MELTRRRIHLFSVVTPPHPSQLPTIAKVPAAMRAYDKTGYVEVDIKEM